MVKSIRVLKNDAQSSIRRKEDAPNSLSSDFKFSYVELHLSPYN